MFELDQRLQADTQAVGDLPLCRLLLMNDSRYPWLILVPRRSGISEVFALTAVEQQQLWRETSMVAEKLSQLAGVEKMNIASLGNLVPQLHMHVVARKTGDAAWPGPVWGQGVSQPYSQQQLNEQLAQVRALLAQELLEQA